MATYSIKTTRAQEVGLKYSYDHYADKTIYLTQEAWLQFQVDHLVTSPMYQDQQQAQLVSFDQSFATIPEGSQPKARTDIELAIVTNGGTIVPPGPPPNPIPPAPTGKAGGTIPAAWGTDSNPIQVGGTDTESPEPSGPDGRGDNETEAGERDR